MKLSSRIGWFLVAGSIGFCTDGGLLMALTWLGIDPRLGRIFSFAVALVVTWLINRSFAFGDRAGPPTLREFGQYAAASVVAAAINFAIFVALVTYGEPFLTWPIIALAVATVVSMCVNFWSYLRVVFTPRT